MKNEYSNLEKIVFLELTNKQYVRLPNKEYFATYELLSPEEKQQYYSVYNEIHTIWTIINSKPVKNVMKLDIQSIEQYNEQVEPVSKIILQFSKDFEVINLKREVSEEFKNALKQVLGQKYLDNFIENLK